MRALISIDSRVKKWTQHHARRYANFLAEIARLRIRELPEDLCCSITCEIMKDPVMCVGDGHTYERVAIEQWLATGRGTSPATNERLENTSLVTNHMAKKLIAALLEEHRRRAM